MKSVEKCSLILDRVLLTNGSFDFEAANRRIADMRIKGVIDGVEFMHLDNACMHYRSSGHYRNSIIYKRALAEDRKTG